MKGEVSFRGVSLLLLGSKVSSRANRARQFPLGHTHCPFLKDRYSLRKACYISTKLGYGRSLQALLAMQDMNVTPLKLCAKALKGQGAGEPVRQMEPLTPRLLHRLCTLSFIYFDVILFR